MASSPAGTVTVPLIDAVVDAVAGAAAMGPSRAAIMTASTTAMSVRGRGMLMFVVVLL